MCDSLANKVLSWAGSLSGILGALLVASRIPASGWGFLFFLFSSLVWLNLSLKSRIWSLAVLQACFVLINLLGIYRWLLVSN